MFQRRRDRDVRDIGLSRDAAQRRNNWVPFLAILPLVYLVLMEILHHS